MDNNMPKFAGFRVSRTFKTVAVLLIFVLGIVFLFGPKDTLIPDLNISSRLKFVSQLGTQSNTGDGSSPGRLRANDLLAHGRFTTTAPKPKKPYDIVINSYMRSGSSFTGQLLGFHPDVFYWYEPLWNYNSGVYYWGNDSLCFGHGPCSKGMHVGRVGLNVHRMHEALTKMYDCDFKGLVSAVAEKMTPTYSGKVWAPYIECRSNGSTVLECLMKMEEVCRAAKHRATKIVRLTADNLEYLLEHRPNIKAIHLLRDPRAIINSRVMTTWYTLSETPFDNHRGIRINAQDLCARMLYDIKSAIELKKKYPDRFALVLYEDLQSDLKRKSEMLYDYLGLDKEPLKEKLANMTDILANEHVETIKMGDHSNWWRFRSSYSAVKVVDDVCKSVNELIGYRMFSDEEQLKDISIDAFKLDPQLLIENIDKTNLYDLKVS